MHRIAPTEMDTANSALEKRLWGAADPFYLALHVIEADFDHGHADNYHCDLHPDLRANFVLVITYNGRKFSSTATCDLNKLPAATAY